MAIIDDIKCPRCDRKYSGVRSRCPYCGARRIGFGKYSKDNDNAKGKMLISVLILSVFTVAAGIMLLSAPEEPEVTPTPEDTPDIVSLPAFDTPTPTLEPTATPTPTPVVTAMAVKHTNGEPLAFGYDVTVDRATQDLAVFIEPPAVDVRREDIELYSDDEDVFTVDWVEGGVKYGFRITAVSVGNANLHIRYSDDFVIKIIIRIK